MVKIKKKKQKKATLFVDLVFTTQDNSTICGKLFEKFVLFCTVQWTRRSRFLFLSNYPTFKDLSAFVVFRKSTRE